MPAFVWRKLCHHQEQSCLPALMHWKDITAAHKPQMAGPAARGSAQQAPGSVNNHGFLVGIRGCRRLSRAHSPGQACSSVRQLHQCESCDDFCEVIEKRASQLEQESARDGASPNALPARVSALCTRLIRSVWAQSYRDHW